MSVFICFVMMLFTADRRTLGMQSRSVVSVLAAYSVRRSIILGLSAELSGAVGRRLKRRLNSEEDGTIRVERRPLEESYTQLRPASIVRRRVEEEAKTKESKRGKMCQYFDWP